MTGFDFAVTDDSSNEAETTEAEEVEVVPDFVANEVADLYLTSGDWKATLGKYGILYEVPVPDGANHTTKIEVDGETKVVLCELKIQQSDTLEDAGRLLTKYSDAHPQQKLHMIASLFKSTAGKMQRDNDHGIGLKDGKAPEEHFKNSVSYALHFSDLPTITWESLDGGERENIEAMGVNPSELGFDPSHKGPKLLSINGERLPIAVEDGSEVIGALELLQKVPDSPSSYIEGGSNESSDPSVFSSREESDNPSSGSTNNSSNNNSSNNNSSDKATFNGKILAEAPEQVGEFTVDEIKNQVSDITSQRTLMRILSAEQQGKDRSVTDRIAQRKRAVEDSEEDEDEVEAEDGDDEGSVDLTESEMTLASTLIDTGKAEDLPDAAQQIRSL